MTEFTLEECRKKEARKDGGKAVDTRIVEQEVRNSSLQTEINFRIFCKPILLCFCTFSFHHGVASCLSALYCGVLHDFSWRHRWQGNFGLWLVQRHQSAPGGHVHILEARQGSFLQLCAHSNRIYKRGRLSDHVSAPHLPTEGLIKMKPQSGSRVIFSSQLQDSPFFFDALLLCVTYNAYCYPHQLYRQVCHTCGRCEYIGFF